MFSRLARNTTILPLLKKQKITQQWGLRWSSTVGINDCDTPDDLRSMISHYYGKTLETSKDLKTSACCAADAPHPTIRNAIAKVPEEIISKFYGCGNPIPFGINGLNVLDLGSGSGRDCYIAANLVGPNGHVIGVDMTDEQLEVARKYTKEYCTDTLKYSTENLEFRKGLIEMLQDSEGVNLDSESVDLVISNCVVNLSPRKDQVLSGVWNVLKEGGEFYFSDVYCDRRLPEEAREHEVLVGECLGGAIYVEDFRRLCQKVGFLDPRILEVSEITVNDEELRSVVGNARFYSITYRLFKCTAMEDKCEDFGQVAVYKGTIPEHPHSYVLDDHHTFETNKPMLVCGNTAQMTGNSWLQPHFNVYGDMSEHFGLFDCAPVDGASGGTNASDPAPGGCC